MKKSYLLLLSLLMQWAVINPAYAQQFEGDHIPFDEGLGARSTLSYLPDGLTGKGVLVGIVDMGIDYNHINFLDPNTLQTRIKFACSFDKEGYSEARTPEDIAKLPHKDLEHGTHVAGIAAGSYAADGWHGIAPEAGLLMSDMLGKVAQPIKNIFAAADSLDLPLVLNISYEPDVVDGYQADVLLCEELTDNGTKPGRIIVASTGNEGKIPAYDEATIGAEGKARFIMDALWIPGLETTFSFSFKALKEVNLDFRFFFYDTIANKVVTEGITDLSGAPMDPNIDFKMSVNPDNPSPYTYYSLSGEFYVDNDYIVPCIEITGAEGTLLRYIRFAVSTDDDYFTPSRKFYGQLNALAMTPAVISVGAYNPHKEGNPIWEKSSFGFNKYDEKVPDVVAPGCGIISSGSYYRSTSLHSECAAQREVTMADGSTQTVNWSSVSGTSQATPLVTGLIALMLEYDPTLTARRVRELLHESNEWTKACDNAPKGPEQAGNGILNTKALFEALMGVTAIDAINDTSGGSTLFDLYGNRLKKAPAQGFYIRNGCKMYNTNK